MTIFACIVRTWHDLIVNNSTYSWLDGWIDDAHMIRSKLGVCPQDVLPPITNQTCMAYNTLYLKQRSSDNGWFQGSPLLGLISPIYTCQEAFHQQSAPSTPVLFLFCKPREYKVLDLILMVNQKIQTQIQWRFPGTDCPSRASAFPIWAWPRKCPSPSLWQTNKQTHQQTDTNKNTQTNRQTQKLTGKLTNKQTNKQTNTNHTGRQTF